MGKHTPHVQGKNTSDSGGHPNHRWIKMFNVLDSHRWQNVKKIIPLKKHGDQKQIASPDANSATDSTMSSGCGTSGACSLQQSRPVSVNDEKPKDTGSVSRKGRAARLKAMIAKEVNKKRGKHQRSTTCPPTVEFTGHDSNIQSSPKPEKPAVERTFDREISLAAGLDNGNIPSKEHADAPPGTDEKCEPCQTIEVECTDSGINQGNSVEKNGVVEDNADEEIHTLPITLYLKSSDNLGRSATFSQSRELLDAMDLLSMNKEFFLKVLEDPESSLTQHFLAQRASGRRKWLDKSRTFPRPFSSSSSSSSSDKRGSITSSSLKDKQKIESNRSFTSSTVSPQPWDHLDNNNNNGARRRFKDLRQKIKHVVKPNNNERHRVAMDAVLHKVPFGQQHSKDEISNQLKSDMDDSHTLTKPSGNNAPSPSTTKDKKCRVARFSSFNESMDKYNKLFQTSFKKDAKDPVIQENLKLKKDEETQSVKRPTKILGRIHSSPDLNLYLCNRYKDSNNNSLSASESPFQIPLAKVESIRFKDPNIRVPLPIPEQSGSEESPNAGDRNPDQNQVASPLASNNEVASLRSVSTDFSDSGKGEETSCHDEDGKGFNRTPTERLEETFPTPELDLDIVKDAVSIKEAEEGSSDRQCDTGVEMSDYEKAEEVGSFLEHHSPLASSVQVNSKDQADFKYVKDILHLAGYSEDQVLGTWFSFNQPVDPSLFAELESCSLMEPCFLESEDSTIRCNHLLLFDLINEVLLAIYERSVAYWGSPLTNGSQIHPMPKGHHVLEEVWTNIRWYLESREKIDSSLDCMTARDLSKDDGWMNLQFEAENVGLELEGLIFEDLVMEMLPIN